MEVQEGNILQFKGLVVDIKELIRNYGYDLSQVKSMYIDNSDGNSPKLCVNFEGLKIDVYEVKFTENLESSDYNTYSRYRYYDDIEIKKNI